MTKKILIDEAVVKQVLEALENHPGNYKLSKAECVTYNAVEGALREALKVNNKGVNALVEQPAVEPVAWAVYWGLPPTKKNSVHFEKASAEAAAASIRSATEIRPLCHPAPTQQDGTNGVVALQERLRQKPVALQPLTSWQRRQIIMSVKTVGEAIDMVEAIHNITRPTQQPLTELSPEFTDTARAALLWVLWHHQGGSSPVGQPIRFALGMGAHDRLTDQQISEAKRWDSLDPKPAHGITGSKT